MSRMNRKSRRAKSGAKRLATRQRRPSSIGWIRDGAVISVPAEDVGKLAVAAGDMESGRVGVLRSSAGKVVRTDAGDIRLLDSPELRMLDLANSIGVSPAAALRFGLIGAVVHDDRLSDLVLCDEDGAVTHVYDVVVQAVASFSWKAGEESEDVLVESFFARLKALQEAVP